MGFFFFFHLLLSKLTSDSVYCLLFGVRLWVGLSAFGVDPGLFLTLWSLVRF